MTAYGLTNSIFGKIRAPVFFAVFLVTLFAPFAGCDAELGEKADSDETCVEGEYCQDGRICIDGVCRERGAGVFGDACSASYDCLSGRCIMAGGMRYCSFSCNGDSLCRAERDGSCCDTEKQVCLLPNQCQSPTDGDGAEGCMEGDFVCIGEEIWKCRGNGLLEFFRDCAAVGKLCGTDGECVDASVDGDAEGGESESETLICKAYERSCSGRNVLICDPDINDWVPYIECPEGDECFDGGCRSVPGDACLISEGCLDYLEYCLPDYVDAEEGHCTRYCDLEGSYCRRGWYCNHGKCEPIEGYCTSDAHCNMDSFCDRLPGRDDGLCKVYCFMPGEYCPQDTACMEYPIDENFGKCVPIDSPNIECSTDPECPDDHYCEIAPGQARGLCRRLCGDDHPCPSGLNCCDNGICGVGACENDCGGPCPEGHICHPIFNFCMLTCPSSCPEGECCDAESAPDCYPCETCENPLVCGLGLEPCCFGYNCLPLLYGVIGYCI